MCSCVLHAIIIATKPIRLNRGILTVYLVEVWSSLIGLGCDVWWPQLANTTGNRPYVAHVTTNTVIHLDRVSYI